MWLAGADEASAAYDAFGYSVCSDERRRHAETNGERNRPRASAFPERRALVYGSRSRRRGRGRHRGLGASEREPTLPLEDAEAFGSSSSPASGTMMRCDRSRLVCERRRPWRRKAHDSLEARSARRQIAPGQLLGLPSGARAFWELVSS